MSNPLSNPDTSLDRVNPEKLKALLRGHEKSYPKHLVEQFPRIANNLVTLWETPAAMTAYFDKLLITDRPNRQGFPREVAAELFTLSRIYGETHSPQDEYGIWY